MAKANIFADKYLLAIIAVSLAYTVYWINYGFFIFTHYLSGYYDIGVDAYSTYWHLHSSTGLLQFLVTANHISPFRVLLLPLFAIYQQPLTLLGIQDIALALTAIVVYLVCRELIKSKKISFAIALAFLINPGTTGLFFYDVHTEAFMPLFLILAFYLYMKDNRLGFLISYAVLLCVMEAAPYVGASLLAALLFYELAYRSKKAGAALSRRRLTTLFCAVLLTALALLLYYYIGQALVSSYSSTPYSTLSPMLWYTNEISILSQSEIAAGNVVSGSYSLSSVLLFSTIGLAVIFMGMGLTSLADPVLSLLLYSPWIALAFVYRIHGLASSSFYREYYAFAIGGCVVSIILGFLIIMEHKPRLAFTAKHLDPKRNEAFILSSTVILALMLFISVSAMPASIATLIAYSGSNVSAMNYAVSLIPANASVMAGENFAPHLFYVRDLELLSVNYYNFTPSDDINAVNTIYWFNPDYIIAESAPNAANLYVPLNSTLASLYNYTRDNFTILYNESGVVVLKRVQ